MIIIYITAALLSMHSVSSYAADSDADRAKPYDCEECIEPDSEDTTSEGTTPPYTDDDSDEESDCGYEPDGLYEPDKEREAQEREAAQFIKDLLGIVHLNSQINRHKGPTVLQKKTNIGCVTDIWNTHTESWRTTGYNRKDRDRKHPVPIIERNEIVFYHITKAILANAAIHYRSAKVALDGEDKALFAHLIKLCLAFIYRATTSVLVKVPDLRSAHETTLFKLFKEMLCEAFNVTSMSNAYGYPDEYLELDGLIKHLITRNPELNFWYFCPDLAPNGCVGPTDLD
jgi:hypothetical protein